MGKSIVVPLLVLLAAPALGAGADVSPRLSVSAAQYRNLTDDGAWCWFSDPRAVFFQGQHTRTHAGWITSQGTVQVGYYDHQTKTIEVVTLHEKLQADDHDAPSLLFRPDGRLMVFYTLHSGKAMYLRISEKAEDISTWGPVRRLPFEPGRNGITYTNPVRLSAEKGRLYLFWRGLDYKPTYSYSDDEGQTWTSPALFITSPGARPYVKVASNDKDTIHFALTDGHPRDVATNSIYYMAYRAGRFLKADGSVIAEVNSLPIDRRKADVVYDGQKTNVRAWVWDVAEDAQGRPVVVYTRLPAETDHRYHYARFDGRAWQDVQLCEAGRWFPKTPEGQREREPHYSGGIVLDHSDPSTVFLSRPVNGVFEIERRTTPDHGKTWRSVPVTQGSDQDNVRPFVIRNHQPGGPAVLWMSNRRYVHYTHYDAAIKMDVMKDPSTDSVRQPPPPALPGVNADPTIAVFGDTYYLYPTTDGTEGWMSTFFRCWSSKDLKTWKNEGVILDLPKDLSWAKVRAWAPAIAVKNGKYYFYYSAGQCVGVAVGDSPTGPFVDPLGKPLVARGQYRCQSIDPMVFADDDGAAYLYFGQGKCNVVRLNEDMVSFPADQVRDITPPGYNEGTFVLKRKGTYYLMWSEYDTRDPRYSVAYATSNSPVGPFEKAQDNPILKGTGEVKGAGHHSVVQIPGTDQWIIAYHRFRIPDGNGYNRETCLSPMRFDDQGRILPVDVFETVPPLHRDQVAD